MARTMRGFSLVVAMIVMAILAAIVAAAMVYTGQELSSSGQYKHSQAMASCADAARNWAMSQFQFGPGSRMKNTNLSGQVDLGRYRIMFGHMDCTSASCNGVTPLTDSASGTATVDITNGLKGGGRTGAGSNLLTQTYRVVATCIERDPATLTEIGRTEVEFDIRLAL